MTINAHPGLPEFEYIQPGSLAEASRFLVEHQGEARPFLGGTDLFVRMRDGLTSPSYLVDIKNLDETGGIRFDPQKGLRIGAAVGMNRVISSPDVQAHYPLLAEACRSVASYQLRTRATVVGNICNASPAGDTIGACQLYGGMLEVCGSDGSRMEPLDTFFLGPGKTVLKPWDIVTAVQFPLPVTASAGTYIKLGRNRLSDLAIVGVTVFGYVDDAVPSGFRFRVALASIAPTPLIVTQVEEYLTQVLMSEERLQEAACIAEEACSPIDDVRSGAHYRRVMVRKLTYRGLKTVYDQLNNRVTG